MSALPSDNILLAKATQGKRKHDARTVTAARGLRLGLARAAEDLWTLAMGCSGIEQDIVDQETALSRLDEEALILVLTAGEGVHALAAVDRSVLAALIEIQTLGAVYDTKVEPRPFTSTDAAMTWLYLDRVMAVFANSVEDRDLARQVTGYFLEERATDRRAAGLWLPPGDYVVFSAHLDAAEGKRKGWLRLVLPHRELPPPKVERKPTGATAADNGFAFLPLSLETVMTNITIPLSKACNLMPGDFIPLPPDVLNRAELRAAGGHVVAYGKLGQMNGVRALRIEGGNLRPSSAGQGASAEPVDPAPPVAEPGLPATMDFAADPTPAEEPFAPEMPAADFDLGGGTVGGDFGAAHLPEMEEAPMDFGAADLPAPDGEEDFGGMADLDAIEAMMEDG